MSDDNCPNHQRLEDYLAGVLPGDIADTVDGHVQACRDCQSTLQAFGKVGGMHRPDATQPPAG